MSAGAWIQAAIVEALRSRAEFGELAVFDAPPVRSALPYALVEDPELLDWSTKDWIGRTGRVAVILHDAGERPARLRGLLAAVAETVGAISGDVGAGWRVTNIVFARERIARGDGTRWLAMSEFAVRAYRVEG